MSCKRILIRLSVDKLMFKVRSSITALIRVREEYLL